MEPEGSSLYPQDPATGPYLSHMNPGHTLLPCLRLGLPISIFNTGFPTKIVNVLIMFPTRSTCVSHIIVLDLLTVIIFGKSTHYGTLHYESFFSLLLFLPLWMKCCSQTSQTQGYRIRMQMFGISKR
jgi:hypothetical protein